MSFWRNLAGKEMPCKDSEVKSKDWPAFVQMGGSMDLGSARFQNSNAEEAALTISDRNVTSFDTSSTSVHPIRLFKFE
jgi:hypothetical protein